METSVSRGRKQVGLILLDETVPYLPNEIKHLNKCNICVISIDTYSKLKNKENLQKALLEKGIDVIVLQKNPDSKDSYAARVVIAEPQEGWDLAIENAQKTRIPILYKDMWKNDSPLVIYGNRHENGQQIEKHLLDQLVNIPLEQNQFINITNDEAKALEDFHTFAFQTYFLVKHKLENLLSTSKEKLNTIVAPFIVDGLPEEAEISDRIKVRYKQTNNIDNVNVYFYENGELRQAKTDSLFAQEKPISDEERIKQRRLSETVYMESRNDVNADIQRRKKREQQDLSKEKQNKNLLLNVHAFDNEINKVVDFLQNNFEYFSEALTNPNRFAEWIKGKKQALELANDLKNIFTPMASGAVLVKPAILGDFQDALFGKEEDEYRRVLVWTRNSGKEEIIDLKQPLQKEDRPNLKALVRITKNGDEELIDLINMNETDIEEIKLKKGEYLKPVEIKQIRPLVWKTESGEEKEILLPTKTTRNLLRIKDRPNVFKALITTTEYGEELVDFLREGDEEDIREKLKKGSYIKELTIKKPKKTLGLKDGNRLPMEKLLRLNPDLRIALEKHIDNKDIKRWHTDQDDEEKKERLIKLISELDETKFNKRDKELLGKLKGRLDTLNNLYKNREVKLTLLSFTLGHYNEKDAQEFFNNLPVGNELVLVRKFDEENKHYSYALYNKAQDGIWKSNEIEKPSTHLLNLPFEEMGGVSNVNIKFDNPKSQDLLGVLGNYYAPLNRRMIPKYNKLEYMQGEVIDTYVAMRKSAPFGISKGADELEKTINVKMGVPDQYGPACKVPHDVEGYMGEPLWRIRAKQNENFMQESKRLIVKFLHVDDDIKIPLSLMSLEGDKNDEKTLSNINQNVLEKAFRENTPILISIDKENEENSKFYLFGADKDGKWDFKPIKYSDTLNNLDFNPSAIKRITFNDENLPIDLREDLYPTRFSDYLGKSAYALPKGVPDEDDIEGKPIGFFGKFGKIKNWDEDPKIQKFQMQLILEDLIEQKKLYMQSAGKLLNPNELEDNKKEYPFIYAALKLNMALNQISKTHRDALRIAIKAEVARINDAKVPGIDGNDRYLTEAEKCRALKDFILKTCSDTRKTASDERWWMPNMFPCASQSNLADALEKFYNKTMKPIIDGLPKEDKKAHLPKKKEVNDKSLIEAEGGLLDNIVIQNTNVKSYNNKV